MDEGGFCDSEQVHTVLGLCVEQIPKPFGRCVGGFAPKRTPRPLVIPRREWQKPATDLVFPRSSLSAYCFFGLHRVAAQRQCFGKRGTPRSELKQSAYAASRPHPCDRFPRPLSIRCAAAVRRRASRPETREP